MKVKNKRKEDLKQLERRESVEGRNGMGKGRRKMMERERENQ